MKKMVIPVVAVVVLVAGTLIWMRPGRSGGGSTLRAVTVNQAFEHLLYIGLYVATDRGFFREEGLDVTINTGGGDAQAFSALTSGSADFAQGDPRHPDMPGLSFDRFRVAA